MDAIQPCLIDLAIGTLSLLARSHLGLDPKSNVYLSDLKQMNSHILHVILSPIEAPFNQFFIYHSLF